METISAHESIIKMHNILHKDNITNSFDRALAQGKRCSFCEQGISCQLCSNGPCRIKPGADRGSLRHRCRRYGNEEHAVPEHHGYGNLYIPCKKCRKNTQSDRIG